MKCQSLVLNNVNIKHLYNNLHNCFYSNTWLVLCKAQKVCFAFPQLAHQSVFALLRLRLLGNIISSHPFLLPPPHHLARSTKSYAYGFLLSLCTGLCKLTACNSAPIKINGHYALNFKWSEITSLVSSLPWSPIWIIQSLYELEED